MTEAKGTRRQDPHVDAEKEKTKKKDPDAAEELSEEDRQLQDHLELMVERLCEPDGAQHRPALEEMRRLIHSSTTSMTSVPKPLKFLRPHYGRLRAVHAAMPDGEDRRLCADVLSVLAMTSAPVDGGGERECLRYRLVGSQEALASWGHEYVRHLSGEVAKEWQESAGARTPQAEEQLLRLAREIVPYNMAHNAEHEACDLLMEIERLDLLEAHVDQDGYAKVCLYLLGCVRYVPEPEDAALLRCALQLFRRFGRHAEALRLALMLGDEAAVREVFAACPDAAVRKEMAFMLARHGVRLEVDDEEEWCDDELREIMSNVHLNANFLALARELEIAEPKVPDDIYKSHLEGGRFGGGGGGAGGDSSGGGGSQVDSARRNLASSFVNGFVNAAFGRDRLLTDDGNKWLYKNKEHGMMSAAASLGLVLLWDVDGGLTQIDKYLYSNDEHIKAGALLACGIVNCGVASECDPALALLSDYVGGGNNNNNNGGGGTPNVVRIGACFGLGLAYAGSNKEEVLELLLPVVADPGGGGGNGGGGSGGSSNGEVAGVAALACGMVAVGSCNGRVAEAVVEALLERAMQGGGGDAAAGSGSSSLLRDTYARWLPLALGLVYLGRGGEAAEATLAALQVVPEPFRGFAHTLVDACAHAGSGNVLKVQRLLHVCGERAEEAAAGGKEDKDKSYSSSSSTTSEEKDKKDAKKEKDDAPSAAGGGHQGVAVLGIALVAMGEEIGAEMALRVFGHLLRYGEPALRRAVPLALALVSASNPRLAVLDTLGKFSHDADPEVAHNAIFAMGVVGAGTNNARLAAMLRQLAQYHAKDPGNLFMVRLAQGLTHLGKGTLTLCPYHSDRQLMSRTAVAGLLAVLVSFLDVRNVVLGRSHYVLYGLVAAMQPRMLVTMDEALRPLPVSVRVGQALDVVGQAGRPKAITGFQTHTTPVLLAHGERAELATEQYVALAPVLEGFVILRKNPDYEA